ncbi:pyrroline-5-carboxylate reductase [Ideonella paludis]|uniref:Pyrroline-5-carboxylate reductase n=1 Tax=Ideonella paludis TaxID=1233411 RepID=A0ABS5DTG9_9BURK|nr:pyrroline-5-carboxylate reductase [Ideonella paludis]MBQ0934441.1 pyrroline-5-carboxylate reductase [Ideonella paludis]
MSTFDTPSVAPLRVAFIGGGNMARAILGGLLQAGWPADSLQVVEPFADTAEALRRDFNIRVHAAVGASLAEAQIVVWAVKPQLFQEAAAPCRAHISGALQLSVMAGLRSEAIARASGSSRVVRCMPNTPALIGQGMTGLFASAAVTAAERDAAQALLATTGKTLWVEREELLDAVTALSGSGPAYVFYLLEAMTEAGVAQGLSAEQAYALAQQTVVGAGALAQQSSEPAAVLRQRVTSKGGTTHAAITALDDAGVKASFVAALGAAGRRAKELGDEFGQA